MASFFGEINSFNGVSKGSWIETPLGSIQNNQYPIGIEVNIVIRPDRLKLSQEKNTNSKNIVVQSVKYVGETTHVWIEFADHGNQSKTILTKQSGLPKLKKGDHLQLEISENDTFIFPTV